MSYAGVHETLGYKISNMEMQILHIKIGSTVCDADKKKEMNQNLIGL